MKWLNSAFWQIACATAGDVSPGKAKTACLYPKSWVKVEPYGYCVNEIIIFSSNYFTPIAVNAIENMVLLRTILLWGDYGFHQGAKTGQK